MNSAGPLTIYKDWYKNYQYDLTVQLPQWSDSDMREIARPLLNEIDGRQGILYTASFRLDDLARVVEFFEGLGYEITIVDKRDKMRKFSEMVDGWKVADSTAATNDPN